MPMYSYYIEDHCGGWIAADAAKEGYSDYALWKCRWPLTFIILNEDGTELGKYLVGFEAKPDFYATQKQA